jgi:thiol-disulfide isomerase/thioredoxin
MRPTSRSGPPIHPPSLLLTVTLLLACASSAPPATGHGAASTLSQASAGAPRCEHRVPREVCVRCNPSLAPKFKEARDWCAEHDLPESQCFACHPDLTFEPAAAAPRGADVVEISKAGEDVPDLAAHAPRGKVTVFDFYAAWCTPCRKIDAHVAALLERRSDLAVRKLNVVSWETPIAARYLKDAPTLPLVVVYGRDGRKVGAIAGVNLGALDEAIDLASREKAGRP